MSSITVSGLTRTFAAARPPVAALRGVDLVVPEGSLVAVLGPSGCGKTTLLRCIGGLERPDSGRIALGDRTVDGPGVHVPPERRAVGLVPQEGALFPHLDVAANVGFGLNGSGRAVRRRRVEELLDLVGLPGAGARRPHQLSGGQQQRVALARALAPEPDVLLLDEPFSALDAGLRSSLRAEVAALLRRRGTTTLLVTHDQVEAMTMADVIAVMRDGEILQTGRPDEVYRRPVDAWVGSFLGDAVRVAAVRVGDDHLTSPLGPLRLAPGVAHHPGPDVTAFLRPEQIRPVRDAPAGAPRAAIAAVGFLGSEVLVDLVLADGGTVTARWASTTAAEVGTTVAIGVEGDVLAHPPDDRGAGAVESIESVGPSPE